MDLSCAHGSKRLPSMISGRRIVRSAARFPSLYSVAITASAGKTGKGNPYLEAAAASTKPTPSSANAADASSGAAATQSPGRGRPIHPRHHLAPAHRPVRPLLQPRTRLPQKPHQHRTIATGRRSWNGLADGVLDESLHEDAAFCRLGRCGQRWPPATVRLCPRGGTRHCSGGSPPQSSSQGNPLHPSPAVDCRRSGQPPQ
jgi:hypothetical protein